jgi:hypothetical protein
METAEVKVTHRSSLLMNAVTIVSTGIFAYIALRIVAGPDGVRVLVMKSARATEAACMTQAALWAGLADRAAHIYDNARTVNA